MVSSVTAGYVAISESNTDLTFEAEQFKYLATASLHMVILKVL